MNFKKALTQLGVTVPKGQSYGKESLVILLGKELFGKGKVRRKDETKVISKDNLQSQSKWLGHFGVSLSPQCWCTRFGDRTAINNFERDEVSTRREKTAFG